ncbi:hypothetical protein ACFWC0_09970 [Micromonospora chalcea]
MPEIYSFWESILLLIFQAPPNSTVLTITAGFMTAIIVIVIKVSIQVIIPVKVIGCTANCYDNRG